MKAILAVALLLSITDIGYSIGFFFHRDWHYKPGNPWFMPPGHSRNPPEHMPSQDSSPCPLLEQLFSFKVNQLKNDMGGTCTAAWICRDQITGDMTVTDADGKYITINEHWQMHTRPDPNESQNKENSKCPDSNTGYDTGSDTGYPDTSGDNHNGRGDTSMTPTQMPSTQPQMTDIPRTHGGEGLIDIRMGSV